MNLKSRLLKLEQKENTDTNEVVLFIDDICTYKGVQYSKEEFYKLYPSFKSAKCIELE